MINYTIIGHRSKIGKVIKKGLPSNFKYIPESQYLNKLHLLDLVFLSHNSESNQKSFNIIKNIKNIKIIDSSGFSKKNGLKDFKYNHYLLSHAKSNYISNPGCSAFGSIVILNPIKEKIDFCHVNSLFSLSAMSRNGREKYNKSITSVYELDHFHKNEIINFTGIKNLNFTPYLTNEKKGIILDISGRLKQRMDIKKCLKRQYGDILQIVENKSDCLLTEDKILVYIEQKGKDFFIKTKYSNLTVAGANSSIENAIQLFKDRL